MPAHSALSAPLTELPVLTPTTRALLAELTAAAARCYIADPGLCVELGHVLDALATELNSD
jgi:hypothetical protein